MMESTWPVKRNEIIRDERQGAFTFRIHAVQYEEFLHLHLKCYVISLLSSFACEITLIMLVTGATRALSVSVTGSSRFEGISVLLNLDKILWLR